MCFLILNMFSIFFFVAYTYPEILNNEFNNNNNNKKSSSNHSNLKKHTDNRNKLNQTIDASDILAPSELEDSDLLKNGDYNFDLASKSLLFNTLNTDTNSTSSFGSKPTKSKLTHSSSNLSTRSTSKLSQQYKHIPGKLALPLHCTVFIALFI